MSYPFQPLSTIELIFRKLRTLLFHILFFVSDWKIFSCCSTFSHAWGIWVLTSLLLWIFVNTNLSITIKTLLFTRHEFVFEKVTVPCYSAMKYLKFWKTLLNPLVLSPTQVSSLSNGVGLMLSGVLRSLFLW